MAHKKYLLGIDLGSSSIKASLVMAESGNVVSSCFMPENEMPIDSPQADWAEQPPEMWWDYTKQAIQKLMGDIPDASHEVEAIGISYQMHGLVLLDNDGQPLRPAIIWCDSRAIHTGDKLENELGKEYCFSHLLNAPGNFTASKLAWVKENEPEIYSKIATAMLPGDYIAYRLTNERNTTLSGLSEGIMYDFSRQAISDDLVKAIGTNPFPEIIPSFGEQGRLSNEASDSIGINAGTPVTYRAGDQPNNALSLKAFKPGQVAATAGTSGVIYSVSDQLIHDASSRINTFLHPSSENESLTGLLLCINGTGIANRWIKELSRSNSYETMNHSASEAKAAADGLFFFPFGNGAERMLMNRQVNASFSGISFNRHNEGALFRAVQEGIAFSFAYGFDLLKELGASANSIRVPMANLFLSPLFCQLFTTLTNCEVEVYETDGARGAALAAGVGNGLYSGMDAIPLQKAATYSPDKTMQESYQSYYQIWKTQLINQLTS